jgi:hypothetical protein
LATVPDTPLVAVTVTVVTPVPAGVANVPSPRKYVVVLLGGVGTAPPTVALIAGKSLFIAMDGTPVLVVFFNNPVAKPDNEVPFIFTTVASLPTDVTSPVRLALVVTVAALPVTLPVIGVVTVNDEVVTVVNVPVFAVIVFVVTFVGVMLPKVNDIAGVVVGFATVPLTPALVVTVTDVTVPPLLGELLVTV